MPIRHSIIHQIDKKPDSSPVFLHVSRTELSEFQPTENVLHDLNVAYHAKTGKDWGFFHAQSVAFPFSGWLQTYIEGGDFIECSHIVVEHLRKLTEESNLSVGGYFAGPLPTRSNRLPDSCAAPSQWRGYREYRPQCHAFKASRLRQNQRGHPDQSLGMARQPKVAARHFMPKRLKGPQSGRLLPRFYLLSGERRRPGKTCTELKAFSDFVTSEDLHDDNAAKRPIH